MSGVRKPGGSMSDTMTVIRKSASFVPIKTCVRCGTPFMKRSRDSMAQWKAREYCSHSCINRGRVHKSLADRIIEKVEIIPWTGCWIWMGATDGRGYGHLSTHYGEPPIKAYRASYELFVGDIPPGLELRHKCDIASCVNPHHLEPGTHQQNMQDMSLRGRINPKSLLNLRPGSVGIHGAGPKSVRQLLQEGNIP